MENKPVIKISGNITTDFAGVKSLFNFYHKAKEYTNTTIFIDFYELCWFDANLSALLGAIIHKLNVENNLTFSTDLVFLESQFDVLFRNGFLNQGPNLDDERQSTIAFKNFKLDDKTGFVSYIEDDLMKHRGFPPLSTDQTDIIIDSLIELSNNIEIHSKSNYDFFVCGQYYPRQNKLIFTILDLGVGFLPAISIKTNNEIQSNYEAILWSLERKNSTKVGCPGGKGLFDLHQHFLRNGGDIQIITGDTFWSLSLENTILKKQIFEKPFVGSIINLCFSI